MRTGSSVRHSSFNHSPGVKICAHADAWVLHQGDEDVGGEGDGTFQASLQLCVDDSARLLKAPVRPLLGAQPGRHHLQHMGVHADVGPRLQEAAQHEGREPAENLPQVFVRVREVHTCKGNVPGASCRVAASESAEGAVGSLIGQLLLVTWRQTQTVWVEDESGQDGERSGGSPVLM